MNKKILIALTLLMSVIFGICDEKSFAATEHKIKVKRNSESLEIDWNEVSSNFTLMDEENNVLYQGTNSYFKVENLEPDSFYKYFLEFKDEQGKLIDVVTISTFTKKDKKSNKGNGNNAITAATTTPIDPEVDLGSTATVSSTKVELTWESIEGATQYEIYKDDILLTTTQNTTYIDYAVEPNKDYVYTIRGKRKVDAATEATIRSEAASAMPDITEAEIQEMLYEDFEIIKDISTYAPASVAATKRSFRLVYKTFIPQQWVKVPWYAYVGDSRIAYFSGDNRSFDIKSDKFRTRTAAIINFDGSTTAATSFEKSTNPTKAYNSSKVYLSQKSASTTGMKQTFWVKDSKQVNFLVSHSAYDPFLPSYNPAKLDYSYRAEFRRTGGYTITGSLDRAPSHEIGLAINSTSTYKILLKHKNEGLEMLMSGIPQRKFSVSN